MEEKKKRVILIGIYSIENKNSNRIYIGSSKDIYGRLSEHIRKLKSNCHTNKRLQSAFNRDGIDNFSFNIVETFEIYNREELFDKEDEYISYYVALDKAYNIAKARGGRTYATEEEKEQAKINLKKGNEKFLKTLSIEERNSLFGKGKKGIPLSKERKQALSDFWINKPKSKETREKMKKSQLNYNYQAAEDRKHRCSELGKRNLGKNPCNSRKVFFNGQLFETIKDFAKSVNICYPVLISKLKLSYKTALNYLNSKLIYPEIFYVITINRKKETNFV